MAKKTTTVKKSVLKKKSSATKVQLKKTPIESSLVIDDIEPVSTRLVRYETHVKMLDTYRETHVNEVLLLESKHKQIQGTLQTQISSLNNKIVNNKIRMEAFEIDRDKLICSIETKMKDCEKINEDLLISNKEKIDEISSLLKQVESLKQEKDIFVKNNKSFFSKFFSRK